MYLDWREFCSALPDRGTVHLQVVIESQSGTIPLLQTALMLTHMATAQAHAIRLPIESVDMLLPTDDARRARQRRLQQRAELARACAELALPTSLDTAPGLLLVPGLYDDVRRMDGSAVLWTWTGDWRDPDTRTLEPVPHLAAAVARWQHEHETC